MFFDYGLVRTQGRRLEPWTMFFLRCSSVVRSFLRYSGSPRQDFCHNLSDCGDYTMNTKSKIAIISLGLLPVSFVLKAKSLETADVTSRHVARILWCQSRS